MKEAASRRIFARRLLLAVALTCSRAPSSAAAGMEGAGSLQGSTGAGDVCDAAAVVAEPAAAALKLGLQSYLDKMTQKDLTELFRAVEGVLDANPISFDTQEGAETLCESVNVVSNSVCEAFVPSKACARCESCGMTLFGYKCSQVPMVVPGVCGGAVLGTGFVCKEESTDTICQTFATLPQEVCMPFNAGARGGVSALVLPKGHVEVVDLRFGCLDKAQGEGEMQGAMGWKIEAEMKLVLDDPEFAGELEFYFAPDKSQAQWGLGAVTSLWCTTTKTLTGVDFCAEQKESFAFEAAFGIEDLSFRAEIVIGGPALTKQPGQDGVVEDFGASGACTFTQVRKATPRGSTGPVDLC